MSKEAPVTPTKGPLMRLKNEALSQSYSPSVRRSMNTEAIGDKRPFYTKSLRKIFKKFTKIQSEIREWKEEKTVDGCQIFTRRIEGNKNLAFKASMTFETDASAKDFTEFVDSVTSQPNNADRLVCEPDNVYYIKLASVDENTQVYHVRTAGGARYVVKDRDFIIVRTSKTKNNIGLLYGGSFEDDASLYPYDHKCVRGSMTMFCWVVQKKDNDVMKVDYYGHIEPSGSLVVSVFNMSITKKGLAVKRYIDAFKKSRRQNFPVVERVDEELAIAQEIEGDIEDEMVENKKLEEEIEDLEKEKKDLENAVDRSNQILFSAGAITAIGAFTLMWWLGRK